MFVPQGLMRPELMTDSLDNGNNDFKKEKVSQRLLGGQWILE